MIRILSAIFLLTALAVSPVSGDVSTTQTSDVEASVSCASTEMACELGCCKWKNGVCCDDGYTCCPERFVCLPFINSCLDLSIGGNSFSEPQPPVTSIKAAPIRITRTPCPNNTTSCAEDNCCPLPNAVCCSDGNHCCPEGFSCDLTERTCRMDNNEISRMYSAATQSVKQSQTVKKLPHHTCPGGTRQCPSYMNCCLNDNGDWNCCPNTSLNMYNAGTGECCPTIFGRICCPDNFPNCSVLGCTS